jgi:bifunctional UDP-N-acetylglucosamine pyrophosphorylase/glucosamine-1-phosphate N-acetyltransferase
MKSCLPKVVHNVGCKSMINRVVDAVKILKPDNIVVVLGYKSEFIEKLLVGEKIKFAYQKEQLGSADAVKQAQKIFESYFGDILVINGDVPLIKSSSISKLINLKNKTNYPAAVLASKTDEPFGYGRIVRNGLFLEKIIEEKDASPVEKQIKEVNSGIYCFSKDIWKILPKIKPNKAKKEYYITDVVEILNRLGEKVCVSLNEDFCEVMGINNKMELANAERILNSRKVHELLNKGVMFLDINNVYISDDAKIGEDTKIYPGVFVDRNVSIGKNCTVKGSSYIINSEIEDNCVISYSYINGVKLSKNVKIGPFAHLRPETILKENVKVGNFSEIKKSVVSRNSKVNHLSYIGDSNIGANVNIGAGTITCNYDGAKKHQTVIGSNSFIGSNVNFVAPVRIGKNVLIGAGSTITKNVKSGLVAIERSSQITKKRVNRSE